MKSVQFTLVLETSDARQHSLEKAVRETGCNDAMLSIQKGIASVTLDRVTDSPENAILSAIGELERARVPIFVTRIEPSDLVSVSEIANRLHQNIESVQQWIDDVQHEGDFPMPVSGLTAGSSLWSWIEVVEWLMRKENGFEIDPFVLATAKVIKLLNDALRFRHLQNEYQQIGEYVKLLNSGLLAIPDTQYKLF